MNLPFRSFWFLMLLVLGAGLGPLRMSAAERVWSGAVSGRWNQAGNWVGGVLPRAGDSLVFPNGAASRVVSNQLSLSFDVVRFESPYTVTGLPILARGIGGAAAAGSTEIWNRILLRENGELAAAVELRMNFMGSVILSGGMNRIYGGLGLSLQDVVSGPGGLEIMEGRVVLTDTNTYQGLTLVRGGTLELFSGGGVPGGRLGSTAQPTQVFPGGTLRIRGSQGVAEELILAGDGPAWRPGVFPPEFPKGALQAVFPSNVRLDGRITLSSNATVVVGNQTLSDRETRLSFRSVVADPGFPEARLTKLGGGLLRMTDLEDFVAVPLDIQEGAFFFYDPDRIPPRVPPPAPPGIRSDLTVGVTNEVFAPATADLYLPFFLPPGIPPPSRVLAPNSAVFVGTGSTLTVGPAQRGLGNPLRLHRGTVQLLNPAGPGAGNATGWQGGLIEVDGAPGRRVSPASRIIGVFGVDGALTIRALNDQATLRFEGGYVVGGDLTVEGGTNVFAGVAANRFERLHVARGTVLSEQANGAFARTNVVGVDESGASTARLVSPIGNPFQAGTTLEVLRSGDVELNGNGPKVLEALRVKGGRLSARNLAVWDLDFGPDSSLELNLADVAEVAMTVNRTWTWTGPVRADVRLPAVLVPGMQLTLIRNNVAGPIPGEFEGLPGGRRISVGPAEVQLDYAGGDGNDLVLTVLPAAGPPTLHYVAGVPGDFSLRWSAASGCKLLFRSELGSGPDWTPIPAEGPVDGMFIFVTPSAFPGGYFRLDCP